MSDLHIIDGSRNGEEYRVVFHVPVPNEQNKTNTSSLSAAIAEDSFIQKPSILKWIDPLEQAQLDAGTVLELVDRFRPDADKTLAQNRRILETRFLEQKRAAIDFIRNRYAFWRFNRDIQNG